MTPIDWMMSGDTGISSETILSVLTGNRAPQWTDTPRDPADFGRCYRLLANFPGWRERMPEVAAKYPKWGPMAAAWDELTRLYERCCDESGQYTRKSYKANEAAATTLYERMQALNDAGRVAAGWTRTGPGGWKPPTSRTEAKPSAAEAFGRDLWANGF